MQHEVEMKQKVQEQWERLEFDVRGDKVDIQKKIERAIAARDELKKKIQELKELNVQKKVRNADLESRAMSAKADVEKT